MRSVRLAVVAMLARGSTSQASAAVLCSSKGGALRIRAESCS